MIDAATARCINDDLASMLEAFEGFDLASQNDGEFGPYGSAGLPYQGIETVVFETLVCEISRSKVSRTINPALCQLRRDARALAEITPIISSACIMPDDNEGVLRIRLELARRPAQIIRLAA